MYRIIFILQFLLLAETQVLVSQNLQEYEIRGVIMNDIFEPVPFVSIISKKSGLGTISSNNGSFLIKLKETDTLKISSIGYISKSVPVVTLDKEKNYIILTRKIYQLTEVNIIGFTKWEEFKQEFMAKKLSPMEQKVLIIEGLPNPYQKLVPNKEMPSNPISLIYELFKRESILKRKQKRWNKTYKKTWQENHRKKYEEK